MFHNPTIGSSMPPSANSTSNTPTHRNRRSRAGGSIIGRWKKQSSSRSSAAGASSSRHNNHRASELDTKTLRSRLHLMSATGFTQVHELSMPKRLLKFIRLPNLSEYFMSVDHHQIWRRHLAWSLRDGDHLRNAVTSRFASNMVFMSLLLGTEIGVLFSPSKPADTFRAALQASDYNNANFWAAIVLCISIGLTLSTLVANFTAWAIIGAVSPQNSHAILRSSVGLDAAQLPARLVILSIYAFLTWIMIFIYILLPHIWGFVIALFPVVLIGYIVVLYSSFGRLVIYSRAMQQKEIFKGDEDTRMSSRRLFEELLERAEMEKDKNSPLPLYYRSKKELTKTLSSLRKKEREQVVDMGFGSTHATTYVTKILNASMHSNGEIPLPIINDILSDSGDEEEEEKQEESANNGGGDSGRSSPLTTNGGGEIIPQDSSTDLENQILANCQEDAFDEEERYYYHPTLRHQGSSRVGLRRGNTDSGNSTSWRRQVCPGTTGRSGSGGSSSRNLFQNSGSAQTAMATLTL